MIGRRGVVVLGAMALLSGCATASLSPAVLQNLPKASDFPDDELVVLFDETRVDYQPGGTGGAPQRVATRRWRAMLLKPTTLPPVRVDYSRSFTRVESIRAWSFKPDGTGKELSTKDRYDAPLVDGNVLFSDSRATVVPVPPLPVGSIFEFETVTRDLDVTPFVTTEVFGDYMPVKLARLVVTAPAEWELAWKSTLTPTQSTVDGRDVLVFEARDLEAVFHERRAPPLHAVMPVATVRLEKWKEGQTEKSAWQTPQQLSTWLEQRYAEKSKITPAIQKQVDELLTGPRTDERETARKLYEFACRSVQYCAIEIGYGGWFPHSAEEVRVGRYGDCKDKATYLHTLLKAAGISSAPTLIYAHDGTPRPFGFPSMGTNFNHAILAVDLPGGTVYAYPTHRTVPFGQLPPSDQEAPVLELRPGGADVKTTPGSDAAWNATHQQYTLELRRNGDASGTVVLSARGAPALHVKNRLIFGTGRLDSWLGDEVWTRATHVSAATAIKTGDFSDDVELEGTVALRHTLLRGSSGEALLRVSDLFEPWIDFIPETREQPMVWPYAQTARASIRFTLPRGGSVSALPAPVKIDSPIGSYALTWSAIEGGVELRREFVRTKRRLEREDFEAANALATAMLRADHDAAVLQLPVGGAQ
ncbi:MAG: DUF3857 domain-containing protein [Archangium sp.]